MLARPCLGCDVHVLLVAQQLYMSSCFFSFLGMSHLVHIQTHKVTSPHTHKPDQTEININGFDMAKSAAKLLYGPVLVCLGVKKV